MFFLCIIILMVSNGFLYPSDDTDRMLHERGYSLIPSPQQVEISDQDVVIDETWQVVSQSGGDFAVKALVQEAEKLHRLKFSKTGEKKIILSVNNGIVKGTNDPEINKQGYVLKITQKMVQITGNSTAGLFYGVQSVLQLLHRDRVTSKLILPEGEILDWPDLQLRFIHWDTKNHLDRMSALKEYLDRLARIKVNMVSFEIWDKFRFPTDPDIGVKEGFTPAQLQELVNYGMERHIQIVPNIQAPAHMQWVLKYKRYAHLRANGSDYQACLCDPETYKLIFSLYQDVIDATNGVDYLHVSTDEVYYAGICDKCQKNRPYNPENRSLAFVDFVNKAYDYLSKRDRKVIFWAEWPLMPEHVNKLPKDIINGVMRASYFVGRISPIVQDSYLTEQNKHGIRQLVYTAQTASLAPVNFGGGRRGQSMENLFNEYTIQYRKGNPIGAFGAGWDDLGPHSELYWLGWTAVAALSWNRDSPENIERFIAEFMVDFYGPEVRGMVDIYRDMARLAGFWGNTWDRIVTDVPGKGTTRGSYGNSVGKYPNFHPPSATLLPSPALPFTPGLNVRPVYTGNRYKDWIREAEEIDQLATSVLHRLEEKRARAEHNDYNLRVLLTLTRFMRHHARLLINLAQVYELSKTTSIIS